MLGEELSRTGRHTEAAAAFDAVLSELPDDVRALLGAANAKLLCDDPRGAADLWGIVSRRFPGDYSTTEQRMHGQSLLRSGAYGKAREVFENLRLTRPDKHWGIAGLARVAEQTSNWEEALRLWRECMSMHDVPDGASWVSALKRCEEMRKTGKPLLPPREELTKSERARAYFRLQLAASKPDPDASNSLNYGSVLIVSYGRSGSTLLQGVLNSIDGMLIRGENGNVFFDLFQTYEALLALSKQYKHAAMPNAPWFGIGQIDFDKLIDDLRNVARTVILSNRADDETVTCFGFKEIRYDELGDRLSAYLDFLAQLFPEPAFVFLTRELDDVVVSGWWKEQRADDVRCKLRQMEDRFASFAESKTNCFRLTYEDMIARSVRLNALFDFLGAPYRPDVIDTVMAMPHSYDPTREAVRRLHRDI